MEEYNNEKYMLLENVENLFKKESIVLEMNIIIALAPSNLNRHYQYLLEQLED